MFLPYTRAASVGSFKVPKVSAAPLVDEVNVKTTLSTGTFGNVSGSTKGFYVATSTGYAKIEWWDGTSTTSGTGDYATTIGFSKLISSPYNNSSEKSVKIYSTNSSGVKNGNITGFVCYSPSSSNNITYVDIAGCSIIGMHYSGLSIYDTSITSLTLPQSTQQINCNISRNTSLTSLDVSPFPNAISYYLRNNALSSLTTTNTGAYIGSYGKSYSVLRYTYDIRGNNLSASALNTVYTGLAIAGQNSYYGAALLVGGNPGTGTDNPSIATAKNWTVYGS